MLLMCYQRYQLQIKRHRPLSLIDFILYFNIISCLYLSFYMNYILLCLFPCLSFHFLHFLLFFSFFEGEGQRQEDETFKHNSKQYLPWLFQSGIGLEFYFGFSFVSNAEILNFLKKKKLPTSLIFYCNVHFMKLPYEQNFPELCKYRQLQYRACFRLFLNLSSGVYLHLE
jgi:hypothetical protein